MDVLWSPQGLLMDYEWMSNGELMGFIWIPIVFLMDSAWMSSGFVTNISMDFRLIPIDF